MSSTCVLRERTYRTMKQLDVDVSSTANTTHIRLTLPHMTFDLDQSDHWLLPHYRTVKPSCAMLRKS